MKFKWSRAGYYLSCVWAILKNVHATKWPDLLLKRRVCLSGPGIELYFLKISDLLTIKEVVLDKDYERELGIDKGDRVVVDIGAGIGDFSISLATRFPKLKIFAYEPDLRYFSVLGKNIQSSGLKNVIIKPTRIESLSQIVGGRIDFLKIDCEGGVFSIIGNADTKLLKKTKKIVVEYHSRFGNIKRLVHKLRSAGFKTRTSGNRGVLSIGFLSAIRE